MCVGGDPHSNNSMICGCHAHTARRPALPAAAAKSDSSLDSISSLMSLLSLPNSSHSTMSAVGESDSHQLTPLNLQSKPLFDCAPLRIQYGFSVPSSPHHHHQHHQQQHHHPRQKLTHSSHTHPSPFSNSSSLHFSRKLFVGGLAPDTDESHINAAFAQFGVLRVDWPNKTRSRSYFVPRGFCFVYLKNAAATHKLVRATRQLVRNTISLSFEQQQQQQHPEWHSLVKADDDEWDPFEILLWNVPCASQTHHFVQVRPWRIEDAEYFAPEINTMHPMPCFDARNTLFVGGVPRWCTAKQLALSIQSQFRDCRPGQPAASLVLHCRIDVDLDSLYPKGSARLTFAHSDVFLAAIQVPHVKLEIPPHLHSNSHTHTHSDLLSQIISPLTQSIYEENKLIELKPFLMEGEQQCDACRLSLAEGFCADPACLAYLCHKCHARRHNRLSLPHCLLPLRRS